MGWEITKLTPADSSNSIDFSELTFTWSRASGSGVEPRIRLIVSKNLDLSSPVIDTFLTTGTSYDARIDLDPNETYYWDCYTEGELGYSPSPWSFTTKPGELVPVSPILSSDISRTPTIKFTDAYSFGSYKLQLSINSDFTGTLGTELWEYDIALTEYTIPDSLPASTTIYWRVKAYSIANSGEYTSGGEYFTTTYGIPSSPILQSPDDGETSVDLLKTFSWSGSDGATSQTIYIDTNPTFANPTTAKLDTEKSFTFPSGTIVENTTYYWKVVSKNIEGETESETRSFVSRSNEVPDTPTAISPSGAITTILPVFNWSSAGISSAGINYQIQVSTNNLFSNIIFDDVTDNSNSYTMTTELSHDTSYYWRIRAIADGYGSGWSNILSFSTPAESEGDPPSAPTWVYPTDGLTNVGSTPNLQWTEVAGVIGYNVQVLDSNSNIVIGASPITNNYQITYGDQLDFGRTYTARVKSISVDGESDWSTIIFETKDVLVDSFPTITYPQNGDNDVPNIFTITWEYDIEYWQNPKFRLQIHTSSDFNNPLFDQNEIIATEKTINWNEITMGYETLFARVQIYNAGGASNWSPVISFTKENDLTPGKPVILYPSDGDSDIDIPVTIDWQSQNNTTLYQVQVATASDFSSGSIVFNEENNGSSQITISSLIINTQYYVRVRGYNQYASGSGYGEWSDVVSFNTNEYELPGFVNLIKPSNGASSTILTPLFKWSEADYAVTYRLRIYIIPPSDRSPILYEVDDITELSYQLDAEILDQDTKYWWTVHGKNPLGYSRTSEYFSFTTENDFQPGKPILILPEDYSGDVNLEPMFEWTDPTNVASKYKLEVSKDDSFTDLVFVSNYLMQKTLDYGNLPSGHSPEIYEDLEHNTRYYARVKGFKSDNGSGEWSDVITFYTGEVPAPLKVSITNPVNNSEINREITISWDAALYANKYNVQVSYTSSFEEKIIDDTVDNLSMQIKLLKGKIYYLRVKGIGEGGYGQYQTITFKTDET